MSKRLDGEKRRELRLFLSERLYCELELVLFDPMTSKKKYGAVSKVGEQLFSAWLAQVKRNGVPQELME